MSEKRDVKMEQIVLELAGEFVARESNRSSLITFTAVKWNKETREATVFFSVLPEKRQEQVLDFLTRKKSDFRTYLKQNSKLQILPRIKFALDMGEKNRQRIDELLRGE